VKVGKRRYNKKYKIDASGGFAKWAKDNCDNFEKQLTSIKRTELKIGALGRVACFLKAGAFCLAVFAEEWAFAIYIVGDMLESGYFRITNVLLPLFSNN